MLLLVAACTHPVDAVRADPGAAPAVEDTGRTDTAGTGDTAATGTAAPVVAVNPVLAGDHPDPSVLRTVESDGTVRYWLVATVDTGDIPVWTSTDLVTWELASSGIFGVSGGAGDSIEIHGRHYCHIWAPELAQLGPDSYLLSFTASRYDTPQSPCPAYGEDGGVYLAWSARPTGPFADADHPWEPLPAGGQIATCALRDELPHSLDLVSPDCQGTWCHQVIRLDSTIVADPADGRWWLAYAWYTNTPPLVDWETTNLGEHVSLTQLDGADPFAVVCDTSVPQVHAANPHDSATLATLAASCDGCDTMLSNTRGRYDEEMTRDGFSWGVAEAPVLLRHGDLVYLFVSGSAWDSAWYHVYWVAAPTVEELSWENPARIAGRFLIPSDDQAFGHGSIVAGPDGSSLYMVHHHLDHAACLAGDCSRDVWVTPITFEDHGDGRGAVWVQPRWPAQDGRTVEVR
jgi:hypothetical protein